MDRRSWIAGVTLAGGTLVSGQTVGAMGPSLPQRFAAALSAHDMVAFAALFADDYVNHQVSAAAMPGPGPVEKTQKQNSVDYFGARLAGMPDLAVSVETQLVTEDKIAASFVYSGTHGGTYLGFAPTGKPLRFTSCDIFCVRNGLLVEHWGMGDIAGILAQLRS